MNPQFFIRSEGLDCAQGNIFPIDVGSLACTCLYRGVVYGGGFFLACKDFGRMFDNSFPMWAHFLINSHILPGQQCSQPTPTLMGQVCIHACLGVTCHLHFWQNDRGLLHATAVTQLVEWTPNKSQHTKLTLLKKILPPLLLGFKLATFQSRAWRSNQQAVLAPTQGCRLTVFLHRMAGPVTQ